MQNFLGGTVIETNHVILTFSSDPAQGGDVTGSHCCKNNDRIVWECGIFFVLFCFVS